MNIVFQFRNSTKGAHRYEEIDLQGTVLKMSEGAKIGTMYIRKSAMPEAPQHLIIVIEPFDPDDTS